jgi:cob(I)alamin adenosyltransferase
MKGYVQIYTGDEKGETLAVLGLSLRAAGAGFRVFFASFNNTVDDNEINALRRFSDLITVEQFGLGRFIDNRPLPEDMDAARKGLKRAISILWSGEHQLVVLDKIMTAARSEFLTEQNLHDVLSAKPDHVELVITGQKAYSRIIEKAGLVTEVTLY